MNDKNFYVKENNNSASIKQYERPRELTELELEVTKRYLEFFPKYSPLILRQGAVMWISCLTYKVDIKSFTHSEEVMPCADLAQNLKRTDCNFSFFREVKSKCLSDFELKLMELEIFCRTILPSDLTKVLKMCNYKFRKIKGGLRIYF